MSNEIPGIKRHTLGAKFYKPKTEEELKAEIAAQELANRKQMKGATNGSKENNKEATKVCIL